MEFGYDIPDLEGKSGPIHYMKAYRGIKDTAPLFNRGSYPDNVQPSPLYCLRRGFFPPSTYRVRASLEIWRRDKSLAPYVYWSHTLFRP